MARSPSSRPRRLNWFVPRRPSGCGSAAPGSYRSSLADHVLVMTGDWLELGLLGGLERLASLPRVLPGRDHPESTLEVPHDPALRRVLSTYRPTIRFSAAIMFDAPVLPGRPLHHSGVIIAMATRAVKEGRTGRRGWLEVAALSDSSDRQGRAWTNRDGVEETECPHRVILIELRSRSLVHFSAHVAGEIGAGTHDGGT